MEVEDVDALVRPRRGLWLIVALGVTGLAAVGAALFFFPTEAPPFRALVFATARDAVTRDAYEAAVRGAIEGGFEVVDLGDAERPADLAAGIELARSQDALHVVALFVEVLEERPATELDRAFVRLAVRAEVAVSEGDGATVPVGPIEVAAFGTSADDARREALEWGGPAIADLAHAALLERPAVAAFVEDPDPRIELLERRAALRDQRARVEAARGALARFGEHCEEGARALAADAGGLRGGCLSSGCAEEYAFDVLPDGSAALIHTETPHVSVSLAEDGATPRRVETVEHIVIAPIDGSARRTIGTAGNYYTYPSLSPDGRAVVALEDWGNGFGLVAIDVASGARRLVHPFSGFPQAPSFSPDGRQVLLFHRERRRADPWLVLVALDGSTPPRRLRLADLAEWVSARLAPDAEPVGAIAERVPLLELMPAVDAARGVGDEGEEPGLAQPIPPEDDALAAEVPWAPSFSDRLALLDPTDGRVLAWLDDGARRLRRIVGSRDGEVVFTFEEAGSCGVAWWRPWDPEAPLSAWTLPVCVDQARLAPDGAVLGVARVARPEDLATGDLELVRLDPVRRTTEVLTANALRERYPRAGREGSTIVFDRVGEPRYRRFPRVATCWLDASAPPD